MNSALQHLKRAIWFLPLEKFTIGFGFYVFAGTIVLITQGVSILQAFMASLAVGIVLTLMMGAAPSLRRFEQQGRANKPLAWNLLFGPLRSESHTKPRGDPPSGIENEEFRQRMRANQLDSAKRASRKMHDKIIRTGLIVVIYALVFWFLAASIAGFFTALFGTNTASSSAIFGSSGVISFETPKELFILDWQILAVMWFILIILLPSWLIYLLLVSMSGMRIVFLAFGPSASMWIMNMGQLPFFYGLMMIFMFGSILWPFLQQIKYFKPGDASWGTPKGSMRGQPEVRAIVETELAKLKDFITGKSKRKPTRGIIFEGPPGTGKTLYAKEIATEHNLPFILADGAALQGMPMAQLTMKYVEWRANSLADEYGGAIFFIDEAEMLLQVRQGMAGGGQMGGMEAVNAKNDGIVDIYD
ncbi:MAG: ATP-binding protein, partial [Candidatus Nealsonbacteria bacterium]|nr:ATP-binding protein [Candidatus Nealsonbacteria bacterium]